MLTPQQQLNLAARMKADGFQWVKPTPRVMPAIMTIKEVAEYLRVTQRTIHNMKLPRFRLGTRVRYRYMDIQRFIQQIICDPLPPSIAAAEQSPFEIEAPSPPPAVCAPLTIEERPKNVSEADYQAFKMAIMAADGT